MRRPNALIMAVTMPAEDDWQLHCQEKWDLEKPICQLEALPDVWAEKVPTMIDLKPGALPVRWYPVPRKDPPTVEKDAGILIDCQLPWNTPLLPVKKAAGDDYRPIKDLWAVNNAIITLLPAVPNPYTLLSLLLAQASWFTCLD
jgi:hypothetical protein